MDTKIISILNFKGGCTKTSTACGLGAALAQEGQRVLIVDLDPQAHVAAHLGFDEDELKFSIDDTLLKGGVHISKVIIPTRDENLFIAPSRRYLLNARHAMDKRKNRDALVAKALKPIISDYNYIIIDTPPDEGVLSINAMYVCSYIIIPTPLDAFSLMGVNPLIDSYESMKEAYEDMHLDILGVLINRYDKRANKENAVNEAELREEFGDLIFNTRIRIDECMKQAQSRGMSIYEYNSASKVAEDFIVLAREIMERTKA